MLNQIQAMKRRSSGGGGIGGLIGTALGGIVGAFAGNPMAGASIGGSLGGTVGGAVGGQDKPPVQLSPIERRAEQAPQEVSYAGTSPILEESLRALKEAPEDVKQFATEPLVKAYGMSMKRERGRV